jgi:hypothetical protein
MEIDQKFNDVMQSGLAFQILNKPVKNDQLWDIKIFWRLMEYDDRTVSKESGSFVSLEECLDDMLNFLDSTNQSIANKWKGPDIPLIEDNETSNIEIGDMVVTTEGLVVRVNMHDQPDLPFKRIARFATRAEATNSEEINKLVKELAKVEESNKASWDTYGSELCAGSMIGEENAIENKIKELRCQN